MPPNAGVLTCHQAANSLLFALPSTYAVLCCVAVLSAVYHAIRLCWRNEQDDTSDWIYLYNLIYPWLYMPWALTFAFVIRQRTPLSRPVSATFNRRHMLVALLAALIMAWTIGICTSALSLRVMLHKSLGWGFDAVASITTFGFFQFAFHGFATIALVAITIEVAMNG